MLVDYHTHTPLCRHAIGEPEEYVARAVERGIDEIGISDHCPMPAWYDAGFRMTSAEFPGYLDTVGRVRKRFSGKITVRLGLEADYFPGTEGFVRDLLGRADFDYVIGSVHYIGSWGFDNPAGKDRYEAIDLVRIYREYFEMVKGAARSGLFDFIGHFDVVKKFGHRPEQPIDDIVAGALEEMKRAGTAMEVNTSGLRYPCKEIYPSRRILELACDVGVAVTLGSDAHRPPHVGEDYDQALALLKSVGVTTILRYAGRRAEAVRISSPKA